MFLSDGLHVFSCNYFTCCRRPLSSFSYPLGCRCSLSTSSPVHWLLITTFTYVRSSLLGCRCSLSTFPHVHWLSITTLYLCTCPSAFNYDSHLCAFLFVGLQVFALYLSTCPLTFLITTLTSVRFLCWFAGVRSLPLHLHHHRHQLGQVRGHPGPHETARSHAACPHHDDSGLGMLGALQHSSGE